MHAERKEALNASAGGARGAAAPDPVRFEVKFTAPALYAPLIESALLSCCFDDPEYPLNTVHSVYFDTPDMESLEDKRNGCLVKHKARLRWYGPADPAAPPPSPQPAWLEIKARDGLRGGKRRVRLDLEPDLLPHARRPGAEALAEFLRPYLGDGLIPSVRLRYRRRRLVFADVRFRVAVDSRIAAVWARDGLWRFTHESELPEAVVEIKGPASEPHERLLDIVGRFGRKCAFSKYEAALRAVIGG